MLDAVGPLTDFLRAHPASRWRAALYLNLGIIYRRTGHMSKALEAWQRAWDLSKHATEPNARAIADYSVGQLAEFEAYLGRMETLAPLLAEVKGRPMHGAGAANISNASQGLAEMRTRPQDAFRCGPMALHRICLLQGRTDGVMELERSRSTTRGTSLVQVAELAHKIGLNYQMAYREPGAPLIVPAVMHWKVGHFAAIIKQSGGLYQVEDPTFGENIRVSKATLDEEGSGYFVVPAGPLPKGWRPASRKEGEQHLGPGQHRRRGASDRRRHPGLCSECALRPGNDRGQRAGVNRQPDAARRAAELPNAKRTAGQFRALLLASRHPATRHLHLYQFRSQMDLELD